MTDPQEVLDLIQAGDYEAALEVALGSLLTGEVIQGDDIGVPNETTEWSDGLADGQMDRADGVPKDEALADLDADEGCSQAYKDGYRTAWGDA